MLPNKLFLDEVVNEDHNIKLYFRSYLKKDFIERALVITLNINHEIQSLYFSSNDYGTSKWEKHLGFIDCHRWEDEHDLSQMSTLSRRYPTLLEDGEMSHNYARELIAPDVLLNLEDDIMLNYFFELIFEFNDHIKYDWKQLIDNYSISK